MPHRQSILEVRDWLKLVNGKVRIVVKIFCYFVYYLVIASIAYTTTRDQGDYYAETDLSNMETHAQLAFYHKWVWFKIVFFVIIYIVVEGRKADVIVKGHHASPSSAQRGFDSPACESVYE